MNEITPGELAALALLTEAYKRWQGMPPVKWAMGRREAYMLVCGLQLLVRHPDLSAEMREGFEEFGRGLQARLCDDPEIYALMELGWNPEHDVERRPPDQPPRGDHEYR